MDRPIISMIKGSLQVTKNIMHFYFVEILIEKNNNNFGIMLFSIKVSGIMTDR